MVAKRKLVAKSVVCLVLAMSLASPAFAEVSIRVSGIPDKLSFPLQKGTNAVLTATVKGGQIRAVWLSRNRDAQARFMLVRVGEGEYQVNLANEVLSAMLRAEGTDGRFQIFAEPAEGDLVAGIPIHYAGLPIRRAAVSPNQRPPKIYVYVDGKKKVLGPWLGPVRESYYSCPKHVEPIVKAYYFSPENVDKVEVRFDEDAIRPVAEARIDKKTWALSPTKAANVLDLAISPEVKRAWTEHADLELVYSHLDMEETSIVLKGPPKGLDLSGDGAKMTIIQYRSKEVPGSDGYVSIHLGDITARQVLLSIKTADGQILIDQRPVRAGDEVAFTIAKEQYILMVESLVNLLAGDDYGIFRVSHVTPSDVDEKVERQKIERLLDIIEKSDVIFIRNDKEYTPGGMAKHIRKKYKHAGEEIHTLRDFIDKVAARSWISGREYIVRLPGGNEVKAKKWLGEQSASLSETTQKNQ